MKVALQITILMVLVDTPGLTEEFILENGGITKCTVTGFSPGQMAEFILVIM